MKHKGSTTLIAIAGVIMAILVILIAIAGFFIIIEPNQRPAQPEMPAATSTEPSADAGPAAGTDESQPDPGEDIDNDGIPNRIQNLIDLSRISTTTATTTAADPSADTNNDGIPDRIENLIPPAAATPTTSPTAPAPADPNADTNNNGIPDRIEGLMR